jgi:hypothetical protein
LYTLHCVYTYIRICVNNIPSATFGLFGPFPSFPFLCAAVPSLPVFRLSLSPPPIRLLFFNKGPKFPAIGARRSAARLRNHGQIRLRRRRPYRAMSGSTHGAASAPPPALVGSTVPRAFRAQVGRSSFYDSTLSPLPPRASAGGWVGMAQDSSRGANESTPSAS